MRSLRPCGLCGHAVYTAMRSIRPCGLYGHVVREARCRSLGDVFHQNITANTACPRSVFLCPLSFEVDLIGGKRVVVVYKLYLLPQRSEFAEYVSVKLQRLKCYLLKHAVFVAMRFLWPCGLYGHAAIMALWSLRPCGHCGHVVRIAQYAVR